MAGNSNSGARIGKTAGATLRTSRPQLALGGISRAIGGPGGGSKPEREGTVASAVANAFKGKRMDKPKGGPMLVQPPKRYKV